MSYRRTPFALDEHYHCYTRGIDGRTTFQDLEDYERFQESLYLCNDIGAFDRRDFLKLDRAKIFMRPRKRELVAIGSYALMPNHFHIAFQEIEDGGSSKFLQKIGTSYTMYFNAKYERVGGLFIGPCRSRHINDQRYFTRVVQYIHLNIAEIFDPAWKSGRVKDLRSLKKRLMTYRFSSLRDYAGKARPEGAILNTEMMRLVQYTMPPLSAVLEEEQQYYKNLEVSRSI